LFVQDVESEFGNASALAALLREEEVPGTFFAVSQLAMEDSELGPVLRSAGEVGSHTSDHTPLSGLTFPEQTVRLRRSREEIRDWAGIPPAGLRPPEEVFDVNTLRAWHQAGGGYVLAVNQARSASPELHRSPDYDLVLLPRLIKDDYNVFVQEGAVKAARLTEAFLQGTRKLRSIGGLAVVATHTQILGSDRRLGAIRSVIDTARAQGDWWIARAEEVADWWKSRSGVQVTPLLSQDSGLGYHTEGIPRDSAVTETQLPAGEERVIGGLVVTGPAEGSGLSDLWIEITLPGGPEGVFPLVDEVPVPFVVTRWGVRVPVGDLPSGAEKTITLSRRLTN
jgi:peptidoglycan/xylan/chitin deacetylase (PgdA/CDA1 family)